MIRLTGLWKSKGRSSEILTGRIAPGLSLLIVLNPQKLKQGDPDFIAYLAEPAKEEAQDQPAGMTFTDRTGGKYDY